MTTEDIPLPVKMFIFRVTVYSNRRTVDDSTHYDAAEHILSFTHSHNWNRAAVILQLSRLFPEANKFKLFDGVMEIEWENTEEDKLDVIDKLNNPEAHAVIEEDDETE